MPSIDFLDLKGSILEAMPEWLGSTEEYYTNNKEIARSNSTGDNFLFAAGKAF